MKRVYLALAVVGTVVPLLLFVPWLGQHGLVPQLIWRDATANGLARFAWADVIISALAVLAFAVTEARRNQLRHAWLAVLGTLCAGVSLGLPLLLYLRERRLEQLHRTAG